MGNKQAAFTEDQLEDYQVSCNFKTLSKTLAIIQAFTFFQAE